MNNEPQMYYLYIYNEDGFHSGKEEVKPENLNDTFIAKVLPARNRGLKVIITDELDYCVFHMENGIVLFPKNLSVN